MRAAQVAATAGPSPEVQGHLLCLDLVIVEGRRST